MPAPPSRREHQRRGAQERPPRPARHRARDARQADRRRARHRGSRSRCGAACSRPTAGCSDSTSGRRQAMTVTQESAVLIGGRWTPSVDGHTVPVISPATEEPIAHVTLGGVQDIERAVARRARGLRRGPVAADVAVRARARARACERAAHAAPRRARGDAHAGGRHADQADAALARDERARHVRRPRGDGGDLPVGGDPRRPPLGGRDPPGAGRRRRRDRRPGTCRSR